MGLWERIFAAGYDRFMQNTEKAGLTDRRRELLSQAQGRVLELGAGTGVNVDLYPPAISELVLLEPAEPMARRLEGKHPGRQVVHAPAEELPFPDDSFDTVVATLVLCTVREPDRALAEARRVLRPGGRLLFLEHIRSDDPGTAKWQDRLNPIQNRIGCGCNMNRPTPETIEHAGFGLEQIEYGRMPKAPKPLAPMAVGVAAPPDGA